MFTQFGFALTVAFGGFVGACVIIAEGGSLEGATCAFLVAQIASFLK